MDCEIIIVLLTISKSTLLEMFFPSFLVCSDCVNKTTRHCLLFKMFPLFCYWFLRDVQSFCRERLKEKDPQKILLNEEEKKSKWFWIFVRSARRRPKTNSNTMMMMPAPLKKSWRWWWWLFFKKNKGFWWLFCFVRLKPMPRITCWRNS